MIKKPTVLVIGAGASAPYGFPTGQQLSDAIKTDVQPGRSDYQNLVEQGFSPKLIGEFADTWRRANVDTIDEFLRTNPRFRDIGKAAIVAALLPFERRGGIIVRTHQDGDWYKFLKGELTANALVEEIAQNKVSILTYNYDRSLEQYLFESIQAQYEDLDEASTAKVLAQIPIVHLHGQLAPLPWQAKKGSLAYGEPGAFRKSAIYKDNIRTVHDEGHDKVMERAHELIKKASQVVFLGCGLHEVNLRRLIPVGFRRRVFATSKNLGNREINRAKAIMRRLGFSLEHHEPKDVYAYLNEHVEFE